MHRTPPRRHPRVAALVPSQHGTVLVVLDAWEVRAVAITRSPVRLRHLLLAEQPAVVIAVRVPAWLRRIRVPAKTATTPSVVLPLAAFPELRRFAGGIHERALRTAVTLAETALTDPDL